MNEACLILDDGFALEGESFGAPPGSLGEIKRSLGNTAPRSVGEVVFVTAMSGYHELLTDPSYSGQILTMTYPHFGNYGTDDAWSEAGPHSRSPEVAPSGVVTRALYSGPVPEGRLPVSDYLERNGVPGLTGADTRQLTLHLRDGGSRNGLIVAGSLTHAVREESSRLLRDFPPMTGRGLVESVGTESNREVNPGGSPHIALLDCGAKQNIVRLLVAAGCQVTILPSESGVSDLEDTRADALFVSNGPGDPAVLRHQINLVKSAIGSVPVLGICLGHQLISLALGARTRKMAFGHHGVNHPVRDLQTGRVIVTSQNHGFEVDRDSLPDGCEIWFENANDGSVEGLADDGQRIRCVQFHPEAAPGPRDAQWIIDSFLSMVPGYKGESYAGPA